MLTFSIDDLMKHSDSTGYSKYSKVSQGRIEGRMDASGKDFTFDPSQSTRTETRPVKNLHENPPSHILPATGLVAMDISTLKDDIRERTPEVGLKCGQRSAVDNVQVASPDQISTSNLQPGSPNSSSSDTESIAQILLSLERRANLIKSPSLPSSPGDQQGKPEHSYIALISMALLNSPDKKLVLADIYQYIMDNFPYYNNKEKAWRNSVRHNLSLNECFIKSGRAENGKGNYWSIHPACIDDFTKGDYRRRQARRRARKTTKELSMPNCSHLSYTYGYVPMTSSPVGYHPFLGNPECMMWSPSQIASPHSYFPAAGLFTQNVFQSDYFPQTLNQFPRQSMPFYSSTA